MYTVIIDFVQQEKKILLVGLDQQPKYMMERIDIIPDLIPPEQIFETYKDCVHCVRIHVEDEY